MASSETHVVTGAFGFSGKYIAQRLLDRGHRVRTLTNSAHRANPFGEAVQALPFHFGEPEKLTAALEGASALYNTYWVRFNHESFTHAKAVANSRALFSAARDAGVRRIVHVSITNPTRDSPLEYFRGKAEVEAALEKSGVSYGILRPAVLFGAEDILINNIAWMLRRLPVFGVFGNGEYRLQPIFVDDLARLAVAQGEEHEDVVVDAIGPETFTFRALVAEISRIIGKKRPIVRVPPACGYLAARILGGIVGDVILTREEIQGLMAELLYVDSPPAGTTKLTEWAADHAASLGVRYASELGRRSGLSRG